MNSKVTAPAAGTHLPADARRHSFKSSRDRRSDSEGSSTLEEDVLILDGTSARYRENGEGTHPDMENAISYTQTQSGFLELVQKALDRMGEISVICQSVVPSESQHPNYKFEFTRLQNFISDVGHKEFNGITLFSGRTLEVSSSGESASIPLNAIEWNAPEPNGGLSNIYDPANTNLETAANAVTAFSNIQKAVQNLAEMRARVSANMQRLNFSNEHLSVLQQNLSAVQNRIDDVELAKKITQFARYRILAQAGTAMQAQANAVPKAAMRLLE